MSAWLNLARYPAVQAITHDKGRAVKTEIVESKESAPMVTRQKVIDYLRAFGLSTQLTEPETA